MRIQRLRTGFDFSRSRRSKIGRPQKSLNFESLEPRCLLTCDATVVGNWDTYGNGFAHTGYVAGSIGTQLKADIAWSREPGARNVVHDGLLYVINSNKLSVVDLKTGVDLWTREFGVLGLSGGDLTYDKGNLYFLGQRKGYNLLYSVNATTGETNWVSYISMQTPSSFPPVVGNGVIYVEGGYYGGMYGIDQNDGSLKFFVKISDSGSWSPAFYNGRLFTWADNLFAERSPDAGTVLWSIQFDKGQAVSGVTRTALVVADGLAYVVVRGTAYDNKVASIDVRTRSIYRTVVDFAPRFSPTVAHGRVFVASPAQVHQSDAWSGTIRPTYKPPSWSYHATPNSQPIVTDDAVLKSADDKTYIFDRTTGALRFTLPVGGELSLGNNMLLVSNRDQLAAFSLCNSKSVTLAGPLKLEETAGITEAKVSIGIKLPVDLQVQLKSSNPALLQVPGSVIIPAGKTSIAFPIHVINNLSASGDTRIELTASAAGYLNSKLSITLHDDESAVVSNVKDSWNEFNRGINRSGYFAGPLGTYLPAQPEWSAVGVGSGLSPSSDSIFGHGVSLDSDSGQQLWRNEFVKLGLYIDDGSLYTTSSSTNSQMLFSVDPETGAIRWASKVMSVAKQTNISVTDKWLLVGTAGGIIRVNRDTGEVEDQPIQSGVRSTIYQDKLLLTAGNVISALDLRDFRTLWTHRPAWSLDTQEYGDLIAQSGRVAVNTQPGLRVYDVQTGRELWRVDEAFRGQPAMDKDSVFAIQYGLVVQFDAATGRKVRIFECGQQLTANQPIITDDAIIVSSEDRTFVFDRATASVKQWYATGGKAFLTPNNLYLVHNGVVKAYRLKEQPTLAVTVPELIREGDGSLLFSAQISLSHAQPADLNVALHSNLHSRILLPDSVTIPAGQTSATFSYDVVNNSFDDLTSKGYVRATAAGFRSSTRSVVVRDDELPVDGSIPGDWTVSAVDPARSGYVSGTFGTLPFPDIRWQNLSIFNGTSAVTSNGKVFVQASRPVNQFNYGQALVALDSTTGSLIWERLIEKGSLLSAPTAVNGIVYTAVLLDKALQVLAIDQATGKERWTYSLSTLPESYFLSARSSYRKIDLVVSDGILFVPLITVGLLALSQESGEPLYLSAFEKNVTWSPAVLDSKVFIWGGQTFRALELRTGVEVWKKEFDYGWWSSYPMLALADDTAMLVDQGQLVAVDLITREVRWMIQGAYYGNVVIAGDKVFAAEFNVIRAFDLKTGAALEVYYIADFLYGAQLTQFNVTDDAVIVQAQSGDVLVFSRRTTESLWTFDGNSFLMNLAGDTLYLLGSYSLLAISLRSASSYGKADVNRDDMVTPLDALFIINHLNHPGSNPNLDLDVNSNGSVTPMDALLVINWLNKLSRVGNGEGEFSDQGQIDPDGIELFESHFEEFAVDWVDFSPENLTRKNTTKKR